ncbi:hypothetical protein Bbelb_179170 [Branchiostoma belcheri]|nr:hypothetical protein Bbelb_179170 [Branchiostoma belcheri]
MGSAFEYRALDTVDSQPTSTSSLKKGYGTAAAYIMFFYGDSSLPKNVVNGIITKTNLQADSQAIEYWPPVSKPLVVAESSRKQGLQNGYANLFRKQRNSFFLYKQVDYKKKASSDVASAMKAPLPAVCLSTMEDGDNNVPRP